MSNTRFYKIWAGMVKRCKNEKAKQFIDYGGRGIKVCRQWSEFENFRDDLYESYLKHVDMYGEKNTSIDRIDVNEDYTPNNCRWATASEQCRNQRIRRTSKSGVRGVSFHKATGKWQAQIRINDKSVYLGLFGNIDVAVIAIEEAKNNNNI